MIRKSRYAAVFGVCGTAAYATDNKRNVRKLIFEGNF